MDTMKTLSKLKTEPGIWMEEKPLPEVGHNDILIRISKTAICGTDIHIYNWDEWAQRTIPVPMTIGHEFVGIVVEVGNEVKGINPGDRVSGEGHVTCGHCRNCRAGRRHLCRNTIGVGVNRQGCFAEYLSIPAVNAFVVPDSICDDIASIFDPFGNATPHQPFLRSCRRRRADHRSRSHRHHGSSHCQARRRPSCGHQRHQ